MVTLRLETTLQTPEAQACVCWGGGGVDLPAALGMGEPGRNVRRERAQPIWRVRSGGWSVAVTCYQVERAFLKSTYFPCPIPRTGQLRGREPCVSHGTSHLQAASLSQLAFCSAVSTPGVPSSLSPILPVVARGPLTSPGPNTGFS